MEKEMLDILEQIVALLEQGREDALRQLLATRHPADLAEVLEELEDDQRAVVMRLLSDERAAETIAEMEAEDQASILESLGDERAGDILEEMSADDVADLVGELSPQQAEDILDLLEPEDATDVRELLEYRSDTAGGLMTTEFIALGGGLTAQQSIDELRRMAPDAETAYYVYVVNEHEQLEGVLSLRDLIVSPPMRAIREIMRTQILSVHVDEDQEEVARVVKKYNLLAVPVVDHKNVLCGIVTVDDIIDVIEEEATEDILRAAGVGGDEHERQDSESPVWKAVKSRLPWLVGLLFLEMLSGKVIDHFSGVIAQVAILAVFITTMAGEAGNAATQSLAVVVRGLATGDIDTSQVFQIVRREVKVGLAVGAVCGVVLALAAGLWQQSVWIGLITGTSIFLNLTVAKAAGAFFPVIIHRMGIDPAVASGPFITTVTDSTSMLIYFGIASVVLRYAGVL